VITCNAALSDGQGKVFIGPIDVAAPEPGEVRVRIMASGLCHTDWDFVNHRPPLHVMGHEGAGVVESAGSGSAFATGDRVVLNWAMPCRECRLCNLGFENICPNKSTIQGGGVRHEGAAVVQSFGLGTMAEYALVPEAALTKIEPGLEIPWSSACLLGCGVMTGVGSVLNTAGVEPGSSVAVIGCGGVGLNCIQGARIAGAAQIIAIDVVEEKLGWARAFGATDTLLAERGDTGLRAAAQIIHERTQAGGLTGADYAFECTGVPALGFAPLAMVRHGGMALEVSGIDQAFEADGLLLKWDKTYIQPKYGSCQPARDFPKLLGLYADGKLLLDELVSRTYALPDVNIAIEDMLAGRNAKGVIELG